MGLLSDVIDLNNRYCLLLFVFIVRIRMSYRELLMQLQQDVNAIKKRINRLEIRMAFIFGLLFALNRIL